MNATWSRGKIIPMTESGDVPVLKRSGPDFNFLVKRPGGDGSYNCDPTRGRDLAHVMHGYWDPATEEEVCFYKDGSLEYLRYDRKSKLYTYASMRTLRGLVAGEAGFMGVLAAQGPLLIGLSLDQSVCDLLLRLKLGNNIDKNTRYERHTEAGITE